MLGFTPAVEKEKVCRSGSFGDSYALGIAGTGGTSSGASPAELWTFRGFAVGNLELCKFMLVRSGIEEPPTFKELMLDVDDKEMPEAYDLRFCSGVARAEEGVSLFLIEIPGDWLKARSSKEKSPCGVGGPTGPPGTGMLGFIERRFSLRASVGLIVLAPRPKW